MVFARRRKLLELLRDKNEFLFVRVIQGERLQIHL